MFDFTAHDMLTGVDDGSTFQQFDANHSLVGTTHYQNQDLAHHYDHTGAYMGNSQHFGNQVFHHDSTGAMTGFDNQLGSTIFHHSVTGAVTGFDTQLGSTTVHHDATGATIGTTDAMGNRHDALGAITDRFQKLF